MLRTWAIFSLDDTGTYLLDGVSLKRIWHPHSPPLLQHYARFRVDGGGPTSVLIGDLP